MARPRAAAVAGVALVFVAGCRSTRPAPAAGAEPRLPKELRWGVASAEYPALVRQVYRAATLRLEREAPGRIAGSWAVAVDADETLISNLPFERRIAEEGGTFTDAGWTAWVRRRASRPLPGAVEFLSRVRQLGGRIAVVTNRAASLCPDTEADLERFEVPFDILLCRPVDGATDKGPRWRAVEEGTAARGQPPLEIVLWIGDSILDFPGLSEELRHADPAAFSPFGERFFLVPNPFYGAWETSPLP